MKNNMQIDAVGLQLIKHFEGFKTTSYVCPGGKLTIGYGHTGDDVTPHLTITQEQADQLLKQDIAKCEAAINELVTVPLNQNQFNALASWVYNLGVENLRISTMLKELNQGHYLKAALDMQLWNKAKGVPLDGLIKRRHAEVTLFMSIIKWSLESSSGWNNMQIVIAGTLPCLDYLWLQ